MQPVTIDTRIKLGIFIIVNLLIFELKTILLGGLCLPSMMLVIVAVTFVCGLIGAFLAKLIFKKHFLKADMIGSAAK